MLSRSPKDDHRISWTQHAGIKMRQYGLSEQRVRRVLRAPKRKEEAVVPGLVAVMQPSNPTAKNPTEIWVMYKIIDSRLTKNHEHLTADKKISPSKDSKLNVRGQGSKVKVISCWRYPGTSHEREAPHIPEDILREIHLLL